MKKISNKIVSVILLLLTIFATGQEAKAYSSWPSDLYLVQHTDYTCTLVSNVMMIRARLHLAGREYSGVYEESVMPYGWINGAGQRTSYSYSYGGATFNINQAYVNGLTVGQLQQILANHPEGVCIYVTSIPHAQWVSDVTDGVVYTGDSSCAYYSGRHTLANSYQGQCCGYNQDRVLANVTSYWYISSTNIGVTATEKKVESARNLPDGIYRIAWANKPGYNLDIYGGTADEEAQPGALGNVQIYENNGSDAQKFKVTWNGEYYYIQSVRSGHYLDLLYPGNTSGANAMQCRLDGTITQHWALQPNGDGTYSIVNAKAGLYLDINDGTNQPQDQINGTNVHGWDVSTPNENQKWAFIPVDPKQELPDGDYRIAPAANIGLTLDLSGGGTDNGTNVQLFNAWDPINHADNAAAQVWSVSHLDDGSYKIIAKKANRALNISGSAYRGGPNAQIWDYIPNDAGMEWILKQADDGSFYIVSKTGQYLDIHEANVESGTNVKGWIGNSGVAQKWKFIAVNGEQSVEDGVYNIVSAVNQAYGLDVNDVSTVKGANIHLWTIADGLNQMWRVKHIGAGYYSISPCHATDMTLDVYEASSSRGANVQQYTSEAGNVAQQWIIREVADGQYNIINRNGLFLDIYAANIANGTNIQGWYGNGTAAQMWMLKKANYDDSKPVVKNVVVSDVTSEGYRVTCTVEDNVGVAKVTMPVWTEAGGQDDLRWETATISGNKASFYVKTADHNNETGKYFTHIYAYDRFNNDYAVIVKSIVDGQEIDGIMVPSAPVEAKGSFHDVVVSDVSPAGFRITCRLETNIYAGVVHMAAWAEDETGNNAVWHEATLSASGDMVTCYIPTVDHHNKNGRYTVHIYARDKRGEIICGHNAGQIDVPVTHNGYYRIACAGNTALGLDVERGNEGVVDRQNIQIWTYDDNALHHKYKFEYNGDGYYYILECRSGRALDVANGVAESGVNVQVYPKGENNQAQLWRVVKNSDDTYSFVNKLGYTLDVHGGIIADGTNVTVYEANNTIAQKWVLIPIDAPAPPSVDQGNRYETYEGGRAGKGVVIARGIDVSEHQGSGFDFAGMKARGVDFVILRCGWVGRKDFRFEEYYNAAKAAGLKVGAYFYSYAENTAEALQEANVCLEQIAGKTFEYPIYFDFEDPTYQGYLNSAQSRDICLTFLDRVASQGYLVGLYSMAGWIDEDYGGKVPTNTVCQKYECWVANYVSSVDAYISKYSTRYGMFQYSDGGTTAPTGGFGVDSNVCYKDYPTIVSTHHFNGY